MVFFVNVAADVYGSKHNIRLEFPLCPSLSELINTVESQYDVTARANRPVGYPDLPFRVQTFQIYDDILFRWVDLVTTSQLSSGCQIYTFQPPSVWVQDLEGSIPAPKETVTWASSVGSPLRARVAADRGAPPTTSEKLRSVFFDMDVGSKGYILYSDLKDAFQRYDIEFTYSSVGSLFDSADRNHDGRLTYDEWVTFALSRPSVVDALFFRMRDLQGGAIPSAAASISFSEELAAQRRLRMLELDQQHRESQYARQRASLQADYEDARREAELARERARAAAQREQLALDRLYYAPSSPSRWR